MLLYFLLALIAVGVLILSDNGKMILYVIGCILGVIGGGYLIFYGIIIIYGITVTINESGPFNFFKEYWVPILAGIAVLGIYGPGVLDIIHSKLKHKKSNKKNK